MSETISIALVLGSNQPERFCDLVASWALEAIVRAGGFETDVVDPTALDLPVRHPREPDSAVQDLRARIGRADAIVVVTPEYNHGYPAALKHLIDLVSSEWHAKPVGFVSYGGLSGGIRAVEQLRSVFAELHAITVRDAVAFPNTRERFDAEGQLAEPRRFERQATVMLERVRWWAAALKAARLTAPYPPAIPEQPAASWR
jgi:NAD(P)H-dependent FMN reductase